MKYKCVLLMILSALAASLPAEVITARPGMKADVVLESFYYPGQEVKGTKTKVDRSGFYREWKQTGVTTLFNSDPARNKFIQTHFWNQQTKNLFITMDLGGVFRLDEVKVTVAQGKEAGNYPESCMLYTGMTGMEKTGMVKAVSVQNPQNRKAQIPDQYDIVLKCPPDNVARYVCVELTTNAPMMVIGGIQITGEKKTDSEIKALPKAWRFEPESVDGTVKDNFSNVLGGAIWVGCNVFQLEFPKEAQNSKLTVFVRYMDNGPRTLEVLGLQGPDGKPAGVRLPENNMHWVKAGEFQGKKLTLNMNSVGSAPPALDSVIFSADSGFDPEKYTLGELSQLPVLEHQVGFAEKLYKSNPKISTGEFIRKVAEHYKIKVGKRKAFTDKNGALLWNGKPFFPVGFYHLGSSDERAFPLHLNCYIDGIESKINQERPYSVVTGYHALWFAYDKVIESAQAAKDSPAVLMHYTCDEPENVGVSVNDLRRLNELVAAFDPNHPTFVNVSAGMAGNAGLVSSSDVIGVDHYPIPSGRIFDMGSSVDNARLYSGGKPVVFVTQSFNWGAYGNASGRWPTPDEMSVMTWIPIIYGCRGLWFYEFPAPRMESKTCIRDINPELWQRLLEICGVLQGLQPELTGPEAEFPGKYSFQSEKGHLPSLRFAVSAEKDRCILIVANAWETPAEITLNWTSSGVKLTKLCANGVESEGTGLLRMAAMSSAVYRVEGAAKNTIVTLTPEQALKKVAARMKKEISRPEAEVPFSAKEDWTAACDLLDTWQSSRKLDSARILATPSGLKIRVLQRFPKDTKAKVTQRDGEVWSDPSVELFIGKPGSRKYAHLQLNIINTQADTFVNMDAVDNSFDKSKDYKWTGKVSAGQETADYEIEIPWESVRQMTGLGKNEDVQDLSFNLASGCSAADWSGLTGGSCHVPARFGILHIKRK